MPPPPPATPPGSAGQPSTTGSSSNGSKVHKFFQKLLHPAPNSHATDGLTGSPSGLTTGQLGSTDRLGRASVGRSGAIARTPFVVPVSSDVPKIRIGICAMDKKANSKPMKEIVSRLLASGEFEIVSFGDQVILDCPIEQWPECDCMLSWYSDGFPLSKAQAYADAKKPFLVNDLHMQDVLQDRRQVYQMLVDNNIPVPTHIIVNRDGLPPEENPVGFVEEEDYVELYGERIYKPFVEKPASGEDHNIHIYYPHSMGGGVKRLFRKVNDKSSCYDPKHPGNVRTDGSYIYEEFLPTGGTDVKVYTVGPRYAHAEARKSPVVDGKVLRTADGKEMRFPVLLSPQEKEIARMVCLAFGQKVCGFDLLRSEKGKSYVCDVNGWSFVKNSKKYYDDAAGILRSILLSALAPHRLTLAPPPPTVISTADSMLVGGEGDEGLLGLSLLDSKAMHKVSSLQEIAAMSDLSGVDAVEARRTDERSQTEELRCVLAVIRHGDRTPKQKMKMRVTQPELLELFYKYMDSKGKQAKLKSPNQLQELLDITRSLLQKLEEPPPAPLTDDQKEARDECREKFRIVRTVLEQGGHFSGINRKVQLKPLRWAASGAEQTSAAGAPPASPSSANGMPVPSISEDAEVSLPPAEPSRIPSDGTSNLAPSKSALSATEEHHRGTIATADGKAPAADGSSGGSSKQGPPAPAAAPATPTTPTGPPVGRLPGLQKTMSMASVGLLSPRGSSVREMLGQPVLEEAMLILKYGGVLTHAGRQQAEELGRIFRLVMYPRYGSAGGGLLRLHSTYRHDLKIYSSDEGRVQSSAAAFTKGLLDLEGGSLTPILVSLVQKDASMLDAFGKGASEDIRHAKNILYSAMTYDPTSNISAFNPLMSTTPTLKSPAHSPTSLSRASSVKELGAAGPAVGSAATDATSVTSANSSATSLQRLGDKDSNYSHAADLAAVAAAAAASPSKAEPTEPRGASPAPPSASGGNAGVLEAGGSTDIPEMPEKPLKHLSRLVDLMKVLVEQLRDMCMREVRSDPAVALSRGQRYSSLSQDPREWELDADRPCSGEKLLLMFDRWQKLYKSFFKKGKYDISKVPDIYDSAKYDVIHNSHLQLAVLDDLYRESKILADAVIPNEYGIDPYGKLRIGSKICAELLGKLILDLESMREESVATMADAEGNCMVDVMDEDLGRGSGQDDQMMIRGGGRGGSSSSTGAGAAAATAAAARAAHAGGDEAELEGESSFDDADKEPETMHRLCPMYASEINSPLRHVRTRIYFTSESHIHSLVNVLRFCHLAESAPELATGAYSSSQTQSQSQRQSLDQPVFQPAQHAAQQQPGGSSSMPSLTITEEAFANDPESTQQQLEMVDCDVGGLLSEEGRDLLRSTTELDYLTHLVFRLYENKAVPADAPERFRVEILFSPGAGYDPTKVLPMNNDHTLPAMPRFSLHGGDGATLKEFERLLLPFAAAKKLPTAPAYALQVGLKAPPASTGMSAGGGQGFNGPRGNLPAVAAL